MFEVQERDATVANVNFRAEKHGDQNKTAVDIKLEIEAHKSVLDHFSPALEPFLFRDPVAGEQMRLDVDQASEKRTSLRVPKIGGLKWSEKFPGFVLVIPSNLEDEDPLLEMPVDLSKFFFEPCEGGSVVVTFNASGHPTPEQSAYLVEQIQEVVTVSLLPPKAKAQQDDSQGSLKVDSEDLKKILVVAVDFLKNGELTETTVTTSEGRPIKCEPVPYKPSRENVVDLLKFKGYDPEFSPAAVSETWPEKNAA